LESSFDQLTKQLIEMSPNPPNLLRNLKMVSCTINNHPNPLSRVMS